MSGARPLAEPTQSDVGVLVGWFRGGLEVGGLQCKMSRDR
jgi:hypothetical protein